MKINHISLYNFGSYEGETTFDTQITEGRNIILIGGKNGAGKTTLFTAMRVCLYGYVSMGYKSQNSYYKRAITKLINNNAKITRPTSAHVMMEIALSNGRDIDVYRILRAWVLSDALTETFTIEKNDQELSSYEVADFEKYLFSLIPPELFNLYFFDGEKIADFFLNEGSNERIKEAFLTLCGYDTFDIMRRNFKRVGAGSQKASPVLDEYMEAKETADKVKQHLQELLARLAVCIDEITTCEADIAILEKEYSQTGGITQEEWNQKLATLKEEEKKRESWNALIRKWANDLIPFLMVRDQVQAVKEQIIKENNSLKYRNFCEVLNSPEIQSLLVHSADEIKQCAFERFGTDDAPILELSFEQSSLLMTQINWVLEFDKSKIIKCKKAIKHSIAVTAQIRQELEDSNVSSVQEYMRRRAELFEHKSQLLAERVEMERESIIQAEAVKQAEITLARVQSRLEEGLKKASINDISAKAIVMLDKLQALLYQRQIKKVEDFFRAEIRILMRKSSLIDDIRIDNDFNTHIFRTDVFEPSKLVESLRTTPEDQLSNVVGRASLEELQRIAGTSSVSDMIKFCEARGSEPIKLPVEIDKMSLSNGEKQIFIMALYHSLVQLCNYEIPFVIDTPFARIDAEHRRNISQHFFSKLQGQIFILSTDEEIDSDHVAIMKNYIATTYMLESTEAQRTSIIRGSYFEV